MSKFKHAIQTSNSEGKERKELKLSVNKSELDMSVVMAWVGSPAQSQMRLFLEYSLPRNSVVMSQKKNMVEAVTCDIASSDWFVSSSLLSIPQTDISLFMHLYDVKSTLDFKSTSTKQRI